MQADAAAKGAELAEARAELKAQLATKDGQVNGLVQELAATQQQLNDSQGRLDQVHKSPALARSLARSGPHQPAGALTYLPMHILACQTGVTIHCTRVK